MPSYEDKYKLVDELIEEFKQDIAVIETMLTEFDVDGQFKETFNKEIESLRKRIKFLEAIGEDIFHLEGLEF